MINIGKTQEDVRKEMGERFKKIRLLKNWTRETLSEKSGVPISTIKKFETEGMLGLDSILALAETLGFLNDFNQIAQQAKEEHLEDPDGFKNRKRQRGMR